MVVIAGDISPIDVIAHMPVACEEAGVPYVYVPSKQHLGAAGLTKRPTSIVLIPVVRFSLSLSLSLCWSTAMLLFREHS